MAEPTFQLFTSLRYDAALCSIPNTAFKHAGWNLANASPWYMLDFHRDRMLRAATHWGWKPAIELLSGEAGLERLRSAMAAAVAEQQQQPGPFKVRVTVGRLGELDYDIAPVPETPLENLFPLRLPPPGLSQEDLAEGVLPRKEPIYEVILDLGTTTRSEYTHFKTTRRAMYDEARQRAGISGPNVGPAQKEVLIVHEKDGSIMEGSTTTPYFWRNGRWVTPPVSAQYSTEVGSGGQDGTSRRWALERCVRIKGPAAKESRLTYKFIVHLLWRKQSTPKPSSTARSAGSVTVCEASSTGRSSLSIQPASRLKRGCLRCVVTKLFHSLHSLSCTFMDRRVFLNIRSSHEDDHSQTNYPERL